MDYIVMDLEWNQNPYGKNNHHPDIPFEIIEIGAVRVTEDREIRDLISRSSDREFTKGFIIKFRK